jgi:hypothetical protein
MTIDNADKKFKLKSMILIVFVCMSIFTVAQNSQKRYLDSADAYLYLNPNVSLQFLDSVSKPIKSTLKGHLTAYYGLRGFVYFELDNIPKTHQNFLLAIESAELEKNYKKGGDYCIELHNLELDAKIKDRDAILEKARWFYRKSGNPEDLLHVEQQRANRAFYKNDFEECVELNLQILDETRKAKDQYIRLLTTYMLSSSYYNLLDFSKGEKFFSELRTLRGRNGVEDKNYFYDVGSLNYDKAIYYYKTKNLDSAKVYFNQVQAFQTYLGAAFKKDYYELGVDMFNSIGEIEVASLYKDSIMLMQELENSFSKNESFDANKKVIVLDNDLKKAGKANIWFIASIVLIIIVTVCLFYRYNKKLNEGKAAKNKKTEEILLLKKEQQKMSVSIVNLEEESAH